MREAPKNQSLLTWALAGLASALVTIVAEAVISRFIPADPIRDILSDFLVGLNFGAAIAACLVIRRKVRSIWKILSLLMASIAAYDIAVKVTIAFFDIYPRSAGSSSESLDIPTSVFFPGGFCGSLIIFLAIVLLSNRGPVGWRLWGRVALFSAVGGLLGMLGWILTSTLGRALLFAECGLHLLPWQTYSQGHDSLQPGHLSLFVVWQAGVALSTGILVSEQNTTSANVVAGPIARAATTETNVPIPLRIASFIFFAGALVFLSSRVYLTLQVASQVAQRDQAYKHSVAEAPPVKDLPPMLQVPTEQTLIVDDMGGLFVTHPSAREIPGRNDASGVAAPVPPSIEYYVTYKPTTEQYQLGVEPGVRVWITQFPNEEWALYKTKYPTGFNPALNDQKYLTRVAKAGNVIIMNTLMRYPNGAGPLSYVWRSGHFVITIQYETRDINEEFLTRYLEKYPSDLR
jgi:hypothetical protein